MAKVNLHLGTAMIWDHFYKNVDRLQDFEDCIAESPENGMSLYLTAYTIFPQLILYKGTQPTLFRLVRNSEECSKWAIFLITKFVAEIPTDGDPDDKPNIIDLPMSRDENKTIVSSSDLPDVEEGDSEEQKILDMIYEREDQLSQAMGDLLATILFEEDGAAVTEVYGKELIGEAVDDFLQYLADQHSVSVYRPTLETDPETGEEILKEFPYGWDEDYEDIE